MEGDDGSSVREEGSGTGFDSRFDALFQPGYVEPDASRRSAQRTISGEAAQPGAHPQVGARPRRAMVDRFVVVLWVVGAALVTLGAFGIGSLVTGYDRGVSEITFDYLILVVVTQVSPWVLTLGLATLIGTLFLLATRWERRP